jgi:hypothetical protein
MMRALASLLPPTAKGMTKRTILVGNAAVAGCARTGAAARLSKVTAQTVIPGCMTALPTDDGAYSASKCGNYCTAARRAGSGDAVQLPG